MVRTLPDSLMAEVNEWFHSAERLSADAIAAVILVTETVLVVLPKFEHYL